jgi:hypothetical protein
MRELQKQHDDRCVAKKKYIKPKVQPLQHQAKTELNHRSSTTLKTSAKFMSGA